MVMEQGRQVRSSVITATSVSYGKNHFSDGRIGKQEEARPAI